MSGCGTTPVVQGIQKPLPIEAMEAPPAQLCKLRPEIVALEIQDQLAMLLACHVADAETYRRLELKHKALVEWIGK